ncbi:flagellar biosynthesis protein FlhA [Entomospira entomophila]|uniref:Flagellar biosynthesis protein FlhA n=1 Tax=Entomospira entomophila TaxID=2719988 RepID=A0A968KTT0_9SPIO|nr:flagellar biosynthesis protein FlhA [Entomospira entomophilus]NIZ40666.1 flagellar biosynthesis protein FlhA [Entomospira entomophilus]WDI34880.1 flagellar biosynthesis protein FlhA [Entomospira entomophilus]
MASIPYDIRSVLKRSLLNNNGTNLIIGLLVIAVVLFLIIPLPSFIVDFMLALNLTFAILIILLSLYVKEPVQFSIFPTLLLLTTVFGLALNVTTTRLILSQGPKFDGKMIRAFSQFVVGNGTGLEGLVVGFVVFIIIIAVQVMVITKGATRVSEVAARFALDSMQMKQMSIESEFNNGAITEEEMTYKKMMLQRTMDFYGAMDGATKFISGSVKAGILTTIINIVGGLIIGVAIRGENFNSALLNYTTLTIGDGLVSQLPALLISVATGLLVTRSVGKESFGDEAKEQFSRDSQIYWIAGTVLFVLALLPGFPRVVLLLLSGLIFMLAFVLSRREYVQMKIHENEEAKVELERKNPEIAPVVPLDTLSLELGYGLIPLVDKEQGAELLERITRIRREAALDLGLVAAPIRIVDNMRLDPGEYCLKIKGVEVGGGHLRLDQYMAINAGGDREAIFGDPTNDPTFGLPALWITDEERDRAERLGYTVVDSPSIVATHLTEIIKNHAHELLGRQDVKRMLDELRKDFAAVVDDVNKHFTVGEIQKVLQALLYEQVSIRNIVSILETLGDYGSITKETSLLVEKCRQTLGRQITLQYLDDDKILRVLTIEPELEQAIIDSRQETSMGPMAALHVDLHRQWLNALLSAINVVQGEGFYPIVLCSESARPLVKNSCTREAPNLAVLSILEVASDVQLEKLGEIRLS